MEMGDGENCKIVWLKGQHPVKIQYPLEREKKEKLKSLQDPEISLDDASDILAELCIETPYNKSEVWKLVLSSAKNWKNAIIPFVEVYYGTC